MWEGVGDRSELQHIDPHSIGHNRVFSVLLSCSTGGVGAQPLWDMFLNPASYLLLIWSPTDWISCALSYIIVQRPRSSWGCHNFALIQPVYGQGYNILILQRLDAPIIYTGAFPILTARSGRRSIYNKWLLEYFIHFKHEYAIKSITTITRYTHWDEETLIRNADFTR